MYYYCKLHVYNTYIIHIVCMLSRYIINMWINLLNCVIHLRNPNWSKCCGSGHFSLVGSGFVIFNGCIWIKFSNIRKLFLKRGVSDPDPFHFGLPDSYSSSQNQGKFIRKSAKIARKSYFKKIYIHVCYPTQIISS